SCADARHDALFLETLSILGHDQSKSVFDQRGQRTALCGGLALGAVKQVCGQTYSRSFIHTSRHISAASICPDFWATQRRRGGGAQAAKGSARGKGAELRASSMFPGEIQSTFMPMSRYHRNINPGA